MEKLPVVAAFDFDGTLTFGDSLLPFLLFSKGYCKTALNLLLISPHLLAYLIKIKSRQETKERVLKTFFKDVPLERMEHLGNEFAEHHLHKILIPNALNRLRWHQRQGHRCILISANLEVYLKPWGEQNGFQAVLASRLKTDGQGRVTGELIGKNCWGEEKVRRLEEFIGSKDEYELYAYGDSRGDRELLALADHPFYNDMPQQSSVE